MELEHDGAERSINALSGRELELFEELASHHHGMTAGVRITHDHTLSHILAPEGTMDGIAKSKLGNDARPVRAILFDKHPGANWALGWHQDRTIAVKDRLDVPGFGPWSRKAGIDHVEPPFAFIERYDHFARSP